MGRGSGDCGRRGRRCDRDAFARGARGRARRGRRRRARRLAVRPPRGIRRRGFSAAAVAARLRVPGRSRGPRRLPHGVVVSERHAERPGRRRPAASRRAMAPHAHRAARAVARRGGAGRGPVGLEHVADLRGPLLDLVACRCRARGERQAEPRRGGSRRRERAARAHLARELAPHRARAGRRRAGPRAPPRCGRDRARPRAPQREAAGHGRRRRQSGRARAVPVLHAAACRGAGHARRGRAADRGRGPLLVRARMGRAAAAGRPRRHRPLHAAPRRRQGADPAAHASHARRRRADGVDDRAAGRPRRLGLAARRRRRPARAGRALDQPAHGHPLSDKVEPRGPRPGPRPGADAACGGPGRRSVAAVLGRPGPGRRDGGRRGFRATQRIRRVMDARLFERLPAARLRRLAAVTAAAAALLVAGCSGTAGGALVKAEPGPVPAAPQRMGDPEIGRDVIESGRYMTCGMPYAAWRRVGGAPGSGAESSASRDGLPYYMSVTEDERGVEIANANCLLCHAALFDGEPVIGLGNESLDFTDDPSELADAVGAYVLGPEQAETWRKWADRIAAIAPYMITDTVGVNPAPNLTLALIAHRDAKTLAWHDTPQMEPPPERPLPLSVPPWWRVAKKHAVFYNGMGRGDQVRFMMMKSLVCTDGVDEAERIEEMFTHVRAYIASLEPPAYPYPIDEALAARGEPIFAEHCSSCHGTYGEDGEYPNRLVALDVVGTDPAYALQAYEDSDRFMRWFNRSWYGERAEAR